jgi:hypothetical protein
MINGRAYGVAEAQSIPDSFFPGAGFDEEDVANVEATAKRVLEELSESAKHVRDAVSGKLLPLVDFQPPAFEKLLLREAGELMAFNGARVTLSPCANGELCVTQYIENFQDRLPMGYLRKDEWLALTISGVHTTTEHRPCLLCIRNQYTRLKLNYHLSQKSRAHDVPWSSARVQPFFNACTPNDPETYREDVLLKIGDFPGTQRSGFSELIMPMVQFNKNDYFWFTDTDGMLKIDQSRTLTTQSGNETKCAGAADATDGAAGLLDNGAVSAAPRLPETFFGEGRGRVHAALQPSLYLSCLCAPLYSSELRELLFAPAFCATARSSEVLQHIDPGPALGYTSWYEAGGRLERLASDTPVVRLLVVRLLVFGLLRKVKYANLAYWLHLFIDQHMPFYSVVLHKEFVGEDDVVEPCGVVPICERSIPLDAFLSLNSILSYRAWGSPTEAMTRMALKFMPNTTTSWDKSLTWDGLPEAHREILRPVLRCVFLGNFRHANIRPDIDQRERILNSSIEEILARTQNDPLVISKAIMECITLVLENQGMRDSDDQACKRYMDQTVADCDGLLRMAVASGRPITKSDVRYISKSHVPVFNRSHRNEMERSDLADKTLLAAAHSVSLKLFSKRVRLSVRYCILARARDKTFSEKLRLAGFSGKAFRLANHFIDTERNQKRSYKCIAQLLLQKYPSDAHIMCRLYSCLPSVQRAEIYPLDKATYDRQIAVARRSTAHRSRYHICLVCLTVDIPGVSGWRKEKRFYSDIDNPERVYCPHCEDKPAAIKVSLFGVRLQLMDHSYMMCTQCLDTDVYSTNKINLEGFFICKRCIHKSCKTRAPPLTPIWAKIDGRHLRGR